MGRARADDTQDSDFPGLDTISKKLRDKREKAATSVVKPFDEAVPWGKEQKLALLRCCRDERTGFRSSLAGEVTADNQPFWEAVLVRFDRENPGLLGSWQEANAKVDGIVGRRKRSQLEQEFPPRSDEDAELDGLVDAWNNYVQLQGLVTRVFETKEQDILVRHAVLIQDEIRRAELHAEQRHPANMVGQATRAAPGSPLGSKPSRPIIVLDDMVPSTEVHSRPSPASAHAPESIVIERADTLEETPSRPRQPRAKSLGPNSSGFIMVRAGSSWV